MHVYNTIIRVASHAREKVLTFLVVSFKVYGLGETLTMVAWLT